MGSEELPQPLPPHVREILARFAAPVGALAHAGDPASWIVGHADVGGAPLQVTIDHVTGDAAGIRVRTLRDTDPDSGVAPQRHGWPVRQVEGAMVELVLQGLSMRGSGAAAAQHRHEAALRVRELYVRAPRRQLTVELDGHPRSAVQVSIDGGSLIQLITTEVTVLALAAAPARLSGLALRTLRTLR